MNIVEDGQVRKIKLNSLRFVFLYFKTPIYFARDTLRARTYCGVIALKTPRTLGTVGSAGANEFRRLFLASFVLLSSCCSLARTHECCRVPPITGRGWPRRVKGTVPMVHPW